MPPVLRRLRWPALACLVYLSLLVAWAPARLAGAAVAHWSDGRLTLADTRGTLWSGGGELHLHAPDCDTPIRLGRAAWRVVPDAAALVALDVRAGELSWARVARTEGAWEVRGLRANVPAPALCAVPALAGLRPGGTLEIQAEQWRISPGLIERGRARITWRGTRLSAVSMAPVGDHRLHVTGSPDGGVTLAIAPLGGPLRVEGRGSWSTAQGLRVQGTVAVGAGAEGLRPWIASTARPVAPDRFDFALQVPSGAVTARRDGTRLPRS